MIDAIRARVSGDDALQIVASVDESLRPQIERRVYYPYYWFELSVSSRTLVGTTTHRVSCLVDARARLGATSDPFELERVAVDEASVLPSTIDAKDAEAIAHRYTSFVSQRARRALTRSGVRPLACRIVHRPFWILTCERDPESKATPPLRVLVDGVGGGYTMLPA